MLFRRRTFLASAASLSALQLSGCDGMAGTLLQPRSALDFPGSAAVKRTMRFRFRNPLSIYPATYIWRVYPRRQKGYYTAFFWGNDDGQDDLRTFVWTPDGKADSYYGAHPYPQPAPLGEDHRWEISILQRDLLGEPVAYDRWYTQGFRVWADRMGKHHEFFWNLPYTYGANCLKFTAPATWGNALPPSPALTWGDAPWAPGKEVWNGLLGGIQIYSACLSVQDMLTEATRPRTTALGRNHIWYENLAPQPDDISDKSGSGHHPEWVGSERPSLWKSA